MLTKQEALLGRGARAESSSVREPGKALCRAAHSLGFYGDGVSFRVVSGQSLWLRGLPRGACVTQPGWIPVRRILGGWQDMWAEVSFCPFPSFSVWWWLVSSAFLTGTRAAGPVSGSPSRYIAIPLKYAAGGWLSLTPGIPPGGGLVAESCPTHDRRGAQQAPLSMGFWSGLPFPSPEALPVPRIESTSPVSPALQAASLLPEPRGNPILSYFQTTNNLRVGFL